MCKFLHIILIDIGLLEQTSAFISSDQYSFPEFRVEKPLQEQAASPEAEAEEVRHNFGQVRGCI